MSKTDQKLSLLFYLRKNFVNKEGKIPVMVRITVSNSLDVAFTSNVSIEQKDIKLWDYKVGRMFGKTNIASIINLKIDLIEKSIKDYFFKFSEAGEYISASRLRDAYKGIDTKTEQEKIIEKTTLLSTYYSYIKDMELTVGTKIAQVTWNKYDRTYRKVKEFVPYFCKKLKIKYSSQNPDIQYCIIDHKFVFEFEKFLLIEQKCCHNTTAKYMQYFRSFIKYALNERWILKDPFFDYKITFEETDRGFLTEEELKKIMQKSFEVNRLEQVRDVFIFCCFTGLAYVDAFNLKHENLEKSFDNKIWIKTKRIKTNVKINVPLLKIPLIILEKYRNFDATYVFPRLSNQKMNAYLKETPTL